MWQVGCTAIFKPHRRIRHGTLEEFVLRVVMKGWAGTWRAVTWAGSTWAQRPLLAAPALQGLLTAQHMCPQWATNSLKHKQAHCKIQSKNSKQFSPWISTNKFSLYIMADMQSFATFELIICTLPSTNRINNNSPLMLQSSSPVFFSSFDNRDHSDAFLFFFSVKKGNKKWKMHMHTSRWQPAMTVNYLRKKLKAFDILLVFWKQKATTLSNGNKAFPYNIFVFTEDDITKYVSCLSTHHIYLKHNNSELTSSIILSLVW